MFLDQDNFIHKDVVLSYAEVFSEEYKGIINFFKYPRDIHNGKWDVSPFLYKGKWFKNHKCKKSLEKLKSLKHIFIASYSVFRSGAVVYPHVGYDLSEPVFRVHLPLIVPSPTKKGVIIPEKDCWLKVGGETRIWEVGKLLIFDDTVQHEAQNNTAEDRVILLMDFTRDAFKNV
jgi:beta-hydroxylase